MRFFSCVQYLYISFLDIVFTQFIYGFLTVLNMFLTYKIHWVISSEHLFPQTLLPSVTTLFQVLCQISIITVVYYNLVFNKSSLTLFVITSDNCRPPSSHNILWNFHSLHFITKCILLVLCLVFFFRSVLGHT